VTVATAGSDCVADTTMSPSAYAAGCTLSIVASVRDAFGQAVSLPPGRINEASVAVGGVSDPSAVVQCLTGSTGELLVGGSANFSISLQQPASLVGTVSSFDLSLESQTDAAGPTPYLFTSVPLPLRVGPCAVGSSSVPLSSGCTTCIPCRCVIIDTRGGVCVLANCLPHVALVSTT
jgi:hypothetical protein